METWRAPLDEFTLRYLYARLLEDREKHLFEAQKVRKYDDSAAESFLVRAEECQRIAVQLRTLLGIREQQSEPPPPRKSLKQWPDV